MHRTKLIAAVLAALCLASPAMAGGMDKWFENPDDPDRWAIPDFSKGETVDGNQNGWYITPYDIRPGRFGFSVRDGNVTEATEDSFVFRPNCVWGHYYYKCTLLDDDAEPTGYEPGRRGANCEAIAFSEVQKVAAAGKGLRLSGSVTSVDRENNAFEAKINWAGEDRRCRFELVKVEREKRIPSVHSRLYGPHWRQTFDVYYPEGFEPGKDEPAPVMLNIHGGGWGALDKQSEDGDRWHKRGIVYISINYRYIGEFQQKPAVTVPIAAPLLDAARCLKHIKFQAEELGINPDRIVLSGGSAGGASSCWLALHDDMAEPDSPDPIARMSTRVHAAAPNQAQTSMDPKQMREWIPGITYGPGKFITDFPAGIGRDDKVARFDYWLSKREELLPAIKEFSAYEHASADDPPIMNCYGGRKDIPVSEGGNATHHPKFGEYLDKRLTELGVESYYWCDNVEEEVKRYNGWVGYALFCLDKLLGPGWAEHE